MTPIKPLDGGKHTGRSARNLTSFQWFAAALLTGGKYPEGATLPNGKKVRGIPSDDVIDVAQNSEAFAGIIEYPGDEIGRPTTIITAGRIKIKASGSGKAGDSIKVVAGGKGAKASAGELAIGKALEDWVDGQIVAFLTEKHVAGDAAASGGGAGQTGQDVTSDAPIAAQFGETSPTYSLDPLYSAVFRYNVPAEGRIDFRASATNPFDVALYQNGRIIGNANYSGPMSLTANAQAGEVLVRVLAGAAGVNDLTLSPQFMAFPPVTQIASGDTQQGTFAAGGMRRYGFTVNNSSQWGAVALFFYRNPTQLQFETQLRFEPSQNPTNPDTLYHPFTSGSGTDASGNVWQMTGFSLADGTYVGNVTNGTGQDINPFILKFIAEDSSPFLESQMNLGMGAPYFIASLTPGQTVQTQAVPTVGQQIKLNFSGGLPLTSAGQKPIHAKFVDSAGQTCYDADVAPGDTAQFGVTAGGAGQLTLTPVAEGILGFVMKGTLA